MKPSITVDAWTRLYKSRTQPYQMGIEPTYEAAVEWVDLPGRLVEDWGGGLGYARRYFQHDIHYRVVDASQCHLVDDLVIADLASYQSSADCILMRHVLEHNPTTWESILANALHSFTERMALVTFVEPHDGTEPVLQRLSGRNSPRAWDYWSLPLPVMERLLTEAKVHWTIEKFLKRARSPQTLSGQPGYIEWVWRIVR